MASNSEMSSWIKFFTTSGIPAGPATSYAILFVDNRMQINMLMDLNKEYLRDMGITVMGDIIAILKYAKTAHAEFERDRPALNTSTMKANEKVELNRQLSAGNRMLGHYMRKGGIQTETPPKVAVSPAMAVRLGAVPKTGKKSSSRQPAAELVPVKRVRKVDPAEEGHYVISMPKGTTPRTKSLLQKQKKVKGTSTVFERLGKEVGGKSLSTTTITKTTKSSRTGDVFSRLGGVQAQRERSLSGSSQISILAYKGVLKEDSPKRPPMEKTLTVKIPSIFKDRLTGLQRPEISTTSNISKRRQESAKGVKGRLGSEPQMVSTQKRIPITARGQKSPIKSVGGGSAIKGPKMTVTLGGMQGLQTSSSRISGMQGLQTSSSRIQGRLSSSRIQGRLSSSRIQGRLSSSRIQGRLGEETRGGRIQGRLGGKTTGGRISQSMFGKGNIIKTTKQHPVAVTLVSDKPRQKVTMKERLGTFKAEVSSTTPSFTITNNKASMSRKTLSSWWES